MANSFLNTKIQAPSPVTHLALIMDGNRRWAQRRGLPPLVGHRKGVEVLQNITRACPSLGIRYLTAYAFSLENWQRPTHEVSGLMSLLEQYLKQEAESLHQARVRLRIMGCRMNLPLSIQALIRDVEHMTRSNQNLFLQIAISYSGRDELIRAMTTIGKLIQNNTLRPEDINEMIISQNLDTPDIPDPCLLLRTSGEKRLSNYLLWQLAYTELLFIDKYWPDFRVEDLKQALETYQTRERRFGHAL